MFDRWVEGSLLDLLEDEGVGCIPFSPLAQGLLTDRYLHGIPEGSRAQAAHGFLQEEAVEQNIARTRKLNEVAKSRGQSLAQMAISWLMKDPRITSVLVGASSVDQLANNLKAIGNHVFDATELQQIEDILQNKPLNEH